MSTDMRCGHHLDIFLNIDRYNLACAIFRIAARQNVMYEWWNIHESIFIIGFNNNLEKVLLCYQ